MVKTMKLTDKTHKELTIVSAEFTAKDGTRRTFDETIMEIINYYRSHKKSIS